MTPSPTLPAQESALPELMWNRFIEHHRQHLGVSKVENLIGGAKGLRQQFIDANATPPIQQGVVEALEKIIAATHSHIDGRDLLAELHPRNMLDIKRRVDARETWFEGDWLSGLWKAVKEGRAALASLRATSGENGNG